MAVLLVFLLLGLLPHLNGLKVGSLRLVDNSGRTGGSSGRLEVYYGQWGTVCDDRFGLYDADVACQQLGYTRGYCWGAVGALGFSRGSTRIPIWLDELGCGSNDTALLKCPHSGLGVEDCTHSEDVGVACAPRSDCDGLTTASSNGGGSYVYYYSSGAASTGIFLAVCLCYVLVKTISKTSNRRPSSRSIRNTRLPSAMSTRPPRPRVTTTSTTTTTSGGSASQNSVPEPTKPTTWTAQAPPSYFAAVGSPAYQLQDHTAVEISSGRGQELVSSTNYPDVPPPPYPGNST